MSEIQLMIISAIGISFLHTLAGPDHYLPFIALSKTRGWTVRRTIFWTLICGCAHVWSSVLLALIGAAIGLSLSSLEWIEGLRGGIAAWCLLIFGMIYSIWGLLRVRRNTRHKHFEAGDNEIFVYEHRNGDPVAPKDKHRVTPWVMFIIFLLGPCEPMIPLLSVQAVSFSWWHMSVLVLVYTIFTLLTMIVMVLLGYYGIGILKAEKLEKYMHPLGGATIFICGAGMLFLNW